MMLLISTVNDLYGCWNPPTADFSVDIVEPVVGQSIKFTDTSTDGPTSWSWDFGSGASPGTANTQGPHNVFYTTIGSKNVSLTASNGDGNDTETKNNYINVQPTPVPTAGNNGPVCEGSTLSLTATTISGATYSWSGPNSFTSSEQNPTVSANATTAMAGTYSVTATLYGYTGTAGTTTVTVNELPTFTYTPSHVTCYNGDDGEIVIIPSGGSGVYEYRYRYRPDSGSSWSGWSGWISISTAFDELDAGDYEIEVKDSNGCVQTECTAGS